ncbi:MAG: hypothetical protein AAF581_13585 [Planctomycetota bacterium]
MKGAKISRWLCLASCLCIASEAAGQGVPWGDFEPPAQPGWMVTGIGRLQHVAPAVDPSSQSSFTIGTQGLRLGRSGNTPGTAISRATTRFECPGTAGGNCVVFFQANYVRRGTSTEVARVALRRGNVVVSAAIPANAGWAQYQIAIHGCGAVELYFDVVDDALEGLQSTLCVDNLEAQCFAGGMSSGLDSLTNPVTVNDIDSLGWVPLTQHFKRGDCNHDGMFNIADIVHLLGFLFPNGGASAAIDCQDACDMNDNGGINIADAITGLDALFPTGPSAGLPVPYLVCGADPTPDGLDCQVYLYCP